MNVLIFTVWPVAFWRTPESEVARLRLRFPEVRFIHASSDEEAAAALETADAALASRLSAAMLARAPRLRWIHSPAAAVANLLPLKDLASRSIRVTNSRGIQAAPIAEHVIGGLLVLSRRFDLMLEARRERRWIQHELTSVSWPWSLRGRRMTVLGLGTIGEEVARRAHAFGMRVTGIRRRPDQPGPPFVEQVFGPDRLDDALRGCDVLVISAPFVPETAGRIGAREIALLAPGAILINVARAKIVDEPALVEALESRRLGGAVLDVFEREPLDPASPFWTLPNVVVSPHCAGARPDHWSDVMDLFAANLLRFERSEPLLNLVNSEAGY
jgi:phosphoglycerate dehydrogenase-like enzyme